MSTDPLLLASVSLRVRSSRPATGHLKGDSCAAAASFSP